LYVAQVTAGDLQRIQHQAGALVVERAIQQRLGHLHQRQLDGCGIFEQWQIDGRRA
jgi:hypothetical protein